MTRFFRLIEHVYASITYFANLLLNCVWTKKCTGYRQITKFLKDKFLTVVQSTVTFPAAFVNSIVS